MLLGRAERYIVEQQPDAVVIRMRQGLRGLSFVVFAGAIVAASWWFGPYGPASLDVEARFYWMWSGMWAVFALMGLLGVFYTEDWTITHGEIAVRKGFGGGGGTRRVSKSSTLALEVEHVQRRKNRKPIFPWRLHVLDASGARTRLKIDLQQRESVEELLRTLRLGMNVTVQDPSGARSTASR